MKFFLDTANLDDIKKYNEWGVVDGITTNPSLIAKEGVPYESRIKEILEVVDGPISTEVVTEDLDEMIEQGKKYASWHENIYVKVPMTPVGMQALQAFKKEGVKVNVTLIFSASQALIAMKNGADFISPFIGRLDDISQDGLGLIAEIMEIHRSYDFDTEVLVASVRHPRHVVESAMMGAHICTMPPAILDKLIKHPKTDEGQERFLADWEDLQSKLKK